MHYKYLRLPDDWTAEHAWSVMEFIYQLEELVWDTYEDKLLTLVGPDPPDPTESNSCLSPDLDDDIPF